MSIKSSSLNPFEANFCCLNDMEAYLKLKGHRNFTCTKIDFCKWWSIDLFRTTSSYALCISIVSTLLRQQKFSSIVLRQVNFNSHRIVGNILLEWHPHLSRSSVVILFNIDDRWRLPVGCRGKLFGDAENFWSKIGECRVFVSLWIPLKTPEGTAVVGLAG